MPEDITHKSLGAWIAALAADIMDEDSDCDIMDAAHETVDGSEFCIYPYKARQVLNLMTGTEESEAWDELEGMGLTESPDGLDKLITGMVYVHLNGKLVTALQELKAAKELEDDDDDDEGGDPA